MQLESIKTKNRKRVGRGISAGGGKTAGRGTKGQKSRSGFNIPNRYEGGQTPLSMRLPKLRGGSRVKRNRYAVISLDQISKNFKNKEEVSRKSLVEKGLISVDEKLVKILNNGELTVSVTLSSEIKASKKVIDAIESGKTAKEVKKPVAAEGEKETTKKIK